MSTGSAIWYGVLVAFGAFLTTWSIAFIVRLVNAPVRLYHEQKDRADAFERMQKIAAGAPDPAPSLELFFLELFFDVKNGSDPRKHLLGDCRYTSTRLTVFKGRIEPKPDVVGKASE